MSSCANLRHAQPFVRQFCVSGGVSYSEAGVLGSYGQVLRHLHAIGALRHRARAGDISLGPVGWPAGSARSDTNGTN